MKRLKTISNIQGYTFEELNASVQDKVFKEKFEEIQKGYIHSFTNTCSVELNHLFPNSEKDCAINYIYSLYEGLEIGLTGYIYIEDAIRLANISFTDYEKEIIAELLYDNEIIPIHNDIDTFFTPNMIDLSEVYNSYAVSDIFEFGFNFHKSTIKKDENFNVKEFCNKIKKLEKITIQALEEYCKDMENIGSEILYDDVKEETMEELMEDDLIYDMNGDII